MGCTMSSKHQLCTDRSEAKNLPYRSRLYAEDGVHDVQWTSVLHRPERSGDLEPMGSRDALLKKRTAHHLVNRSFFLQKMGLESNYLPPQNPYFSTFSTTI